MRPAIVMDIAKIQVCLRQAYAVYIPRIGADAPPFHTEFEKHVANGHIHVMPADGEIAAFIISYPVGNFLRIENLAVSPRYQGQGLGKLLLRFADDRAERLRLHAIDLFTHPKLTETIEFYRHNGFERQSPDPAAKAIHFVKHL